MKLPHNDSPWFYLALMLSLVFAIALLVLVMGAFK
jgi:hypothetical protein